MDYETLSHSKWDCKYHVVFIPKYRRKALYAELRKFLGEAFHKLTEQKESRIEEGHLMPDHVHMLISIPPKYAVAHVVGFIEAGTQTLDLPLDLRGTAFQQRVWTAIRDIPRGATASYGELAKRIGHPTATRAVAQACAANPVAVAIPCHRVVRRDGGLSGYRWGAERKQALLRREGAI